MIKKRIMIVSLVVVLFTACATEIPNEDIVETTAHTEIVEVVETTEAIKPVTEPIVPTKPVEVIEETEPIEVIETTYLGQFLLTAYCPCSRCCGKSDGITATGTVATQGRTIAVDPRVISYGSEVIINGNTYIAEDCGGFIDGNRIDVFFNNHDEAWNFGVQYADVYLVRS